MTGSDLAMGIEQQMGRWLLYFMLMAFAGGFILGWALHPWKNIPAKQQPTNHPALYQLGAPYILL